MDQETAPIRKRLEKPAGIYVLGVFDILAAGLFPLIQLVWAAGEVDGTAAKLVMVLLCFCCLVVILAAVMTMRGDHIGRIVLLVSVTMVSAFMLAGSLQTIAGDESGSARRGCGDLVRSVFWLVVNWWYLNKKNVTAYFQQENS